VRLRAKDLAGATAFRGVAGFGARRVLHSASVRRLLEDLLLLVEVTDSAERTARLEGIAGEWVVG
jgi:hypothetical protein